MDTNMNTVPGSGSARETASFKIRGDLKRALIKQLDPKKGRATLSKYLETIVEDYAKRKKIKLDGEEPAPNTAAA
jgi:hypothetical protein